LNDYRPKRVKRDAGRRRSSCFQSTCLLINESVGSHGPRRRQAAHQLKIQSNAQDFGTLHDRFIFQERRRFNAGRERKTCRIRIGLKRTLMPGVEKCIDTGCLSGRAMKDMKRRGIAQIQRHSQAFINGHRRTRCGECAKIARR